MTIMGYFFDSFRRKKMQQKSGKHGNHSILNHQELIGDFLEKRRINSNICGCCEKANCNDCNRFNYIRNQLEKNAFFEIQDYPRQPILWQFFDDFDKVPNNLHKNVYRFCIYIEKTVLSNVLVKKYDFKNDKIIETLYFFLE